MRNENDFYPTPHSIIQALLENLNWEPGQTWEPCAGDGRLVEALLDRGHTVVASDIAEGYDFFEYRAAPVSTLITNPPFKKIRPFIDHAFRIGVEPIWNRPHSETCQFEVWGKLGVKPNDV